MLSGLEWNDKKKKINCLGIRKNAVAEQNLSDFIFCPIK